MTLVGVSCHRTDGLTILVCVCGIAWNTGSEHLGVNQAEKYEIHATLLGREGPVWDLPSVTWEIRSDCSPCSLRAEVCAVTGASSP
jgi:hypothetical protein